MTLDSKKEITIDKNKQICRKRKIFNESECDFFAQFEPIPLNTQLSLSFVTTGVSMIRKSIRKNSSADPKVKPKKQKGTLS